MKDHGAGRVLVILLQLGDNHLLLFDAENPDLRPPYLVSIPQLEAGGRFQELYAERDPGLTKRPGPMDTAKTALEHEDLLPQIDCWEKRAKKHDKRVEMAGEDSETSRHRAEELRRCIAELKQLAGIKDPEPLKPDPKQEEAISPIGGA